MTATKARTVAGVLRAALRLLSKRDVWTKFNDEEICANGRMRYCLHGAVNVVAPTWGLASRAGEAPRKRGYGRMWNDTQLSNKPVLAALRKTIREVSA